MGFSREEYRSGLPSPPPGDLPNPGIYPRSPTLQADSLPSELPGKPKNKGYTSILKKDTCSPMFITAIFTKTKTWKPSKYLSRDEWLKYTVNIYIYSIYIYCIAQGTILNIL
ncbi:unnamed protein product [Rangifer tarandus platyrhynchus]|uniref:Uncharacterized protein n=2 Tax=Rangifer tarandus platyrhynchus TaxID=3082113 RepID=A0ABN8ZLH4_RANTA|nr:unnamed protein product [Rangifer tarandus platyrhynchus]